MQGSCELSSISLWNYTVVHMADKTNYFEDATLRCPSKPQEVNEIEAEIAAAAFESSVSPWLCDVTPLLELEASDRVLKLGYRTRFLFMLVTFRA